MIVPTGGLLEWLFEAQQIQATEGCTFKEAVERWQKSQEVPEPDNNVIRVDFRRKDEPTDGAA